MTTTFTKEELDEYTSERQAVRKFNQWRKDMGKNLPDLATRVFDLRNKGYYGCGFHYALEGNLGCVISALKDFNGSYSNFAKRIVVKVRYEELVHRLEEIEAEIKSTEYEELFIKPLTF